MPLFIKLQSTPRPAKRQPHENALDPRHCLRNLNLRRRVYRLISSHAATLHERRRSRPVSAATEPLWVYVSCCLQQIEAPRRREWRRLRCQLEMRENTLDHRSVGVASSRGRTRASGRASLVVETHGTVLHPAYRTNAILTRLRWHLIIPSRYGAGVAETVREKRSASCSSSSHTSPLASPLAMRSMAAAWRNPWRICRGLKRRRFCCINA